MEKRAGSETKIQRNDIYKILYSITVDLNKTNQNMDRLTDVVNEMETEIDYLRSRENGNPLLNNI